MYTDILSKERCQSLIDRCIGNATRIEDPTYSVYARYDFKSPELSRELAEGLAGGWTLSTRAAFTAYEAGGFIGTHTDGHSRVGTSESTHSALFYLNDDYEGGELVLPGLGLQVHPPAGSVIVMSQECAHFVKKIEKGNKYLLRVDGHASTSLSDHPQNLIHI